MQCDARKFVHLWSRLKYMRIAQIGHISSNLAYGRRREEELDQRGRRTIPQLRRNCNVIYTILSKMIQLTGVLPPYVKIIHGCPNLPLPTVNNIRMPLNQGPTTQAF